MKLSISWIFDHIDADWKKFNIEKLVKQFNETTAEIEAFYPINIDLDNLTLAQVKQISEQKAILYSPEWKKNLELPIIPDLVEGNWYLVKKDKFATSIDLGAEKEMALPAISCAEVDLAGKWKKHFEKEDYIIEVDNKSITNRPDLWSHRGFAREFSLLLNLDLKPEEEFLKKLEIKESDSKLSDEFLTVSIQDSAKCKKLAALYIEKIENIPSLIWMAHTLSKVDSRSINAIVDTTNYVMLDIGQPMHAFDAKEVDKKLIAREAKNGEKLKVLDGDLLELTSNDSVIANDKSAISLAGIMGGYDSGISTKTTDVVLEAGNFDAPTVRLTSTRLKKRSEASARFEKSLDPLQNVKAIERFVKVFEDAHLKIVPGGAILSVGKNPKEIKIDVELAFIEKVLGLQVDPKIITKDLEKIGFVVKYKDGNYEILVPSYRATKDITIKEDIVEEIARIYGYSKIPYEIPVKQIVPHNIDNVLRIRKIKNYLSFGSRMMEIRTYPFFDESFIEKIDFKVENPIQVLNPVSQNWKTLISSPVPNLLKVVETNLYKAESMAFYEWGRVWSLPGHPCLPGEALCEAWERAIENKLLSGIIFEHKKDLDFYECKNILTGLFYMLNLKVEWNPVHSEHELIYNPNLSAKLLCNGKKIGSAGLVNQRLLNKISEEGSAFIFEIDGDFLINFRVDDIKFKQIPKFQSVDLDVSLFVPLKITVKELENKILDSDKLIKEVYLIDSFEKSEWIDKKSLTFRFKVIDETKTLEKEDIDKIVKSVEKSMERVGAQVR